MKNWEFDELIEAVEEEFNDKKLDIINHPEIWGFEIDADFQALMATLSDFTGPELDRESEQIVVKLTLFMCLEKFSKVYIYLYRQLEEIVNKYNRKKLLDLTETEKDRIEEMISYYKQRIKEIDIVENAETQ